MNLRKFIFYLLDKLKGAAVKNYIVDIENVSDHQDQLVKLLSHTVETVPYYSGLKTNNFVDFPIIDKTTIKNDINQFISQKYQSAELSKVTTSGSTGTPFTVFIDKDKKARNTADTIVYAYKSGYTIGQKLYYMKIWSKANHKSKFIKYVQNIETLDVLELDDSRVEKILKDWRSQRQPFGVISYASALETICKYLLKNEIKKVHSKLNSMITISESLDPTVKEELSSIFGVQVVSRYSNVENGIIAQQPMNGSVHFEINTSSYLLEIFHLENDVLEEEGDLGRIVLTDLYNMAQPMIRYDTGDLGSLETVNGKVYLSNLSGRKLDALYNTKGEVVNSLLVYRNMWQYVEVDQYQLIQKSKMEYHIVLSCKEPFRKEIQIKKEFMSYLGEDALISVIPTKDIPLLSSGKRRKVVQDYYK